MMNCLDDGLLHMYLDGELSEEETFACQRHISICRQCNERKDQMEMAKADFTILLSKLKPDRIPLWSARKRRIGFTGWVAMGACVAFLILIGIFHKDRIRMEPGLEGLQQQMDNFYKGKDPNQIWKEEQPLFTYEDKDGRVYILTPYI